MLLLYPTRMGCIGSYIQTRSLCCPYLEVFFQQLGVNLWQSSLSSILLSWGDVTGKNEAHTTIIHTLPLIVCWNLWKNRISVKKGGRIKHHSSQVPNC